MITLEETRAQILARLSPLAPEETALLDLPGRILHEAVDAPHHVPPFDNTSMDGFALRSRDVASASPEKPVELRVVSVIEAGAPSERTLEAGEAARIFTGAPLPPGADAIIPFEQAAHFDEVSLRIDRVIPKDNFVRFRGEELQPGDPVLGTGQRLNPAAIGLLAQLGRARVLASPRLRIAVHSSGNELVDVETEPLPPGKIRNSNLYSLAARVAQTGATVLPRPVLLDTPEDVRAGLRRTLALRPHAILTTGGVSAGDLDYIREVARELGDDVQVRRVDMKPGKPLVDGVIGGVPFFGLPGNPAACLVSFEMFVRPALARLEGDPDAENVNASRYGVARVREDTRVGGTKRRQFLRARVELDRESGVYELLPLAKQGSHLLTSFSAANCLVDLPAGTEELRRGDTVAIVWLESNR